METIDKIKNPHYDLIFLGIDSGISQGNSILMQYLANLGTNLIGSITFMDYDYIGNHIPYKCLENDSKMIRSTFEGMKYSSLYSLLNISHSNEYFDVIDEDFISSNLPPSRLPNMTDSKRNIIIATSSNTSMATIKSVKNLVEESSRFNSITHIHLETGNTTDGGSIFMARSTKDSMEIDYPSTFKFIKNDYSNSTSMYSQSIMSGGAFVIFVVNLIAFNLVTDKVIKFNADSISMGPFNSVKTDVDIPLPGKRKIYKKKKIKKRGRKRTVKVYKKVSDALDIIFVGLGATGSFAASFIIPLLNEHPERVNSIHFVDGDIIERKNALNQRCLESESGTYKVDSSVERYKKAYPNLKIQAHHHYLLDLNSDTIKRILGTNSIKHRSLALLFNVDNHESRKLADNYFLKENQLNTLLLGDSGNGTITRAGQFVWGLKHYNQTILQPIGGTDFGSEVRNNKGDVKQLFGTCARESTAHPQHISTNSIAGISETLNFRPIITDKRVKSHVTHFSLDPIYISAR